jgi:glucose-1-phosphate adenylyltransferase
MELVTVNPEINVYDQQWPIWTYQLQQPPAKFVLDEDGRRGMAVNSMIAGGAIISGAHVGQSLLFSNVRVEERSHIERSVILPDVEIGQGCVICNAILDEGCEIPDNTRIGVDRAADMQRFYVTEQGVVLVTQDMLREAEG